MKVFKFGGASIRNAEAIRNMFGIIVNNQNDELVVVVSAMGKTTNALESIHNNWYRNEPYEQQFKNLHDYHLAIMNDLSFTGSESERKVVSLFDDLRNKLSSISKEPGFNYTYDQLIAYGELISSTIISEYINEQGEVAYWLDARKVVMTDNRFREARIDWDRTGRKIRQIVPELTASGIVITQGFIGGTIKGDTTTLGREGSDFTGAIFSYCLDAVSLTIWKDVPGILNADPKKASNTKKFDRLSYQEAAEMTYYGASVIHPKTIKPLANKHIPLLVRSFQLPDTDGTRIEDESQNILYPTLIHKENQVLISFMMKDLDFINEKNLSVIFYVLDRLDIKINVMQNSAVSLSICVNDEPEKLNELMDILKNNFRILYNRGLLLITVKNYDLPTIDEVSRNQNILLEQRTRNTYQIAISNN